MSAFSRIPVGFLFIDLASSSINKIGNVLRSEAATKEVFDLKKMAHIFVPHCSVNVLAKFPEILSPSKYLQAFHAFSENYVNTGLTL